MPNRYGSRTLSQNQRNIPDVADVLPKRWWGGDPINGFYPTTTPPEMNYWSVLQAKNTYWAQESPGTIGTFIANRIPGDQRFVTLGAGNLKRNLLEGAQAAAGESPEKQVGVFRFLSNRLSPIQDVSDIDTVLAFKDESFDAVKATAEFFEASPSLASLWMESNLDPKILEQANSLTHFHYLVNAAAAHQQAVQRIEQWQSQSGVITRWSNALGSFTVNLLAADPFGTAITLPAGIGGKVLQRVGQGAAGAIRGLGIQAGELTGRAVSSAVFAGVEGAGVGLRIANPLAKIVEKATSIPALVHGGIAAKTGVAFANAVEAGVYGAFWNSTDQLERINDWNLLYDRPEWQRSFSWGELGLATTLSASLVGGLTMGAGLFKSRAEAARVVHSQLPNSSALDPLARAPEGLAAQVHLDEAALRIQRSMEAMTEDSSEFGFLLDRAVLEEHGLDLPGVADFVETVQKGLGEDADPQLVRNLVLELMAAAKKHKEAITGAVGAVDDQLRRAALSDAMALAAKELGPKATSAQVLKRAKELFETQLEKIQKVANKTRRLISKVNPKNKKFITKEIAVMNEIAQQRDLTEAELKYLFSLENAAKEHGISGPQFAVDIMSRPALRAVEFDIGRFKPSTLIGQRALKIAREKRLVEKLSALSTRTAQETKDLRNAKIRLRKATQSFEKLSKQGTEFPDLKAPPPKPRTPLEAVKSKWTQRPPKNAKERAEAVNEILEAVGNDSTAILEDGTVVAKTMRILGMGGLVNKLVSSLLLNTGQSETVRSAFGIIRFLTSLLDQNRLTGESIDPLAKRVLSVFELKNQELRRLMGIANKFDSLVESGKFGSQLSPNFSARVAEFERDIAMGVRGRKIKDPDAAPFVKEIREYFDELGEAGKAAGVLENVSDNFFPNKIDHAVARADEQGFHAAVAKFFRDIWTTGEKRNEIHWDTLVELGKAERVIDDEGDKVLKWVGKEELAGQDSETLIAINSLPSEIGGLYRAALKAPVEGADMTALERSAWRAVRHALNEAEEEKDALGRIHIRRPSGPLSTQERVFTDDIWDIPGLSKYFRSSVFDVMEEYVQGPATRIRIAGNLQEAFGVPGITMNDLIDQAEIKLLRVVQDAKGRKRIVNGMNELRRKSNLASGRTPSQKLDSETILDWIGNTTQGVGQILFGGGFGQLALGTEGITLGLFSKIYSPVDLIDNIVSVFRGLLPILHDKAVREELGALSVGIHRLKTTSSDRYMGGLTNSTFRWRSVPKLTSQLKHIWDVVTLKSAPREGRVPSVLKSAGSMVTQVGALEAITTGARTMFTHASMRELGRFFPAAEKLSAMLAENPKLISETRKASYLAALAAGKSETAAVRAGNKAAQKVFNGLARKAGFGGNWHVAQNMQHFRLLDPEIIAVMRRAVDATDALDTGLIPRLDIHRVKEYAGKAGVSKAETELFLEASKRTDNLFEWMLRKRVNMQSVLNTPTGPLARSGVGSIINLWSSYARAFVDNVSLDLAQLPVRQAAGLAGIFIIGDTINGVIRELLSGKEWEDIENEMTGDPDNFISRMVFRNPWFGQLNTYVGAMSNAATADGRLYPQGGQTAGGSIITGVSNLIQEAVHDVSPVGGSEDRQTGLSKTNLKFVSRLIPGYNTWWYGALVAGVEGTTDIRLRPDRPTSGRYAGNGYRPKPPVFKAPTAESVDAIPTRPTHLPDEFSPIFEEN